MNVVDLRTYRSQHVAAVLRELLQLAESGHCPSIAFAAQIGRKTITGVEGEWRRRPGEPLQAVTRLQVQLLRCTQGNGTKTG